MTAPGFTAPVSGYYLFLPGQPPRLLTNEEAAMPFAEVADRYGTALHLCGATAVFWPDVEACEAECMLPTQHGGTVHEDEVLGEWDEGDLNTHLRES